MAAVAGILFTDAMGLPKWYEAGAQDYDIPATAQLGVLFPVMGFLELKRLQGFKETGTVSCALGRQLAWRLPAACLLVAGDGERWCGAWRRSRTSAAAQQERDGGAAGARGSCAGA
jgi:hypothetical protein